MMNEKKIYAAVAQSGLLSAGNLRRADLLPPLKEPGLVLMAYTYA